MIFNITLRYIEQTTSTFGLQWLYTFLFAWYTIAGPNPKLQCLDHSSYIHNSQIIFLCPSMQTGNQGCQVAWTSPQHNKAWLLALSMSYLKLDILYNHLFIYRQ